jgi:hypothetical protein
MHGPPQLPRWIAASVLAAVVCCCGGCGENGPAGPDNHHGPEWQRVYVDAAYVGPEDGSEERPFNTIQEAVTVAEDGWAIDVAEGWYDVGDTLVLDRAVSVEGAGAESSVLSGCVCLRANCEAATIVIDDISCAGVCSFATGDTMRSSRAPVLVSRCILGTIDEAITMVPTTQWFTIEATTILSDVHLRYESCRAARTFRGCQVSGDLLVSAGDTTSCALRSGGLRATPRSLSSVRVCDSTIGGDLQVAAQTCGVIQVSGNTVRGDTLRVVAASSETTRVSNNVLPLGSIHTAHVSAGHMTVEGNELRDGVVAMRYQSGSVSVHENEIACGSARRGIDVTAIEGPRIEGNWVELPDAVPIGVPAEDDTSACGIRVKARYGSSVTDNAVRGGAYGVYCYGDDAEVMGNEVMVSHVGIWAQGSGVRCADNFVRFCVGDGMVLRVDGEAYGNNVCVNGGAGVRVQGALDLGGGTHGSPGGGVLRGNTGYDLVVDVEATEVDTIFARHNLWDHETESDVGEYDVWDATDDPSLAAAVIMPVATTPGVW